MNILIIPSWYPYPDNPLAGKFFIDQAQALAKHTSHQYFLLDFGQNQYQITLRKHLHNLSVLRSFRSAEPRRTRLRDNLQEIHLPHLSWSALLAKGNLDRFSLPDDLKPDLIYALVTYPAGYLAMRLAAQLKIPYIIAEHSGPFPFPHFMRRGQLSPLISQPIADADQVIAVSTALQAQILQHCGRRAKLIPNMVDTQFFIPSSRKSSDGQLRLFSMSAFTKAKGVKDLLHALYILWRRKIAFEMVWAGDGPLLAEIKKRSGKLPIHFTGRLNKMQARSRFQNSDLYIMPSHLESFSMVLIEAMSCGIPVVSTACGGPSDIVTRETGILCEAKNPGALAGAVIEYLQNSQNYDPLRIRAICQQNYSEAEISKRLNEAFERSVSGQH